VVNNAPGTLQVGSQLIQWTVTDIHGNSTSCYQIVNVIDNELPTISCPAEITVNNDPGHCFATPYLGSPVTYDNCGIDTIFNNAPPTFPIGVTTFTWTVVDIHGNTATCLQTVTVNDTELPTITCPSDISVNNDPGHCYSTVALLAPVTNDNCGIANLTNDAPATFPVGITIVVWTVSDIHGNIATCQQTVTVTDNELPTIICPVNVSVNNDPGECYATVELLTPVTTDNCSVSSVTNNAPLTIPVGTTTVTWTVTDIHGNSKTCQQEITVKDTEIPTIICPSNISANNDPGVCYATLSLVPPVSNDNCGIATVTNDAPGNFAVGSTNVTWTVTDIHGNINTCLQVVSVVDNEKPTIICPDNVETSPNTGKIFATITLGTPVTHDNCGVASLTNNAPAEFPLGTTIVTWIVYDIHGNSDSCQQTVIVTDRLRPIAIDDHDSTLINIPVTIHFLKNDINPTGNPLLVTICTEPENGTYNLEQDSSLVYRPNSDFQGIDHIRYFLYDSHLKATSDTATIYITVGSEIPIIIHNVITPNGDGLNDKWIISGIENYPANDVTIFNRWGDRIIGFVRYDNKSMVWDGTNSHNDPVPDGTYFYIINIENVGKFNGWIYVRGSSR
jgi:gliding motility-associated-like protein